MIYIYLHLLHIALRDLIKALQSHLSMMSLLWWYLVVWVSNLINHYWPVTFFIWLPMEGGAAHVVRKYMNTVDGRGAWQALLDWCDGQWCLVECWSAWLSAWTIMTMSFLHAPRGTPQSTEFKRIVLLVSARALQCFVIAIIYSSLMSYSWPSDSTNLFLD